MATHRVSASLTAALLLSVFPVCRILAMRELTGEEAETAQRAAVVLSGIVVDAATGKPISNFAIQGGRVDAREPARITWGYTLETRGANPTGAFSTTLDWAAGWRSRIVAGGYLSQPILTALPGGTNKLAGLVIRMQRGRQVTGHVLDFSGRPVQDAGVYVVGGPSVNLTGGNAIELAGGQAVDRRAVRAATDATGAFTVTGLGDDAQRIAVTSAALDLWVVPAPPGADAWDHFDIRLPQPGRLIVHYEIAGAPERSKLFMELHTWEMPGWSDVTNEREEVMQQRVALVRDGLPPGKYEVERSRDLGTMGRLGRVFLDRRTVTIESGQTAVTDFVRPQGAAINGQVLGLNQGAVARAKPTYVSIRVLPPREDARTQYLLFDALVMEPGDKPLDGAFVTERLLPGRYKVRAEVFIAETAEQRSSTGIVPPAFEGETLVTVPAQGQPESIQIGLRPFQFPAQ